MAVVVLSSEYQQYCLQSEYIDAQLSQTQLSSRMYKVISDVDVHGSIMKLRVFCKLHSSLIINANDLQLVFFDSVFVNYKVFESIWILCRLRL